MTTKHDDARRILITGSGGPMGVNVTRSLRKAPEPLFLVGTDCNRYHLYLSLTDQTRLIPPARETEAYLAAVSEIVAQERIQMLLPTHPVEVRTLSAHRDALPAGVHLVLPEHQAILRAHDKWQTNQLLAAAGVPVPRTLFIEREEDLRACFDELTTRPIWVRGSGVPGVGIGVASLPCRKLSHATAWVDHWNGWGKFIASEYLPGRNLTWCGLFFDGALVACQCRERLEYVIPHVSPSGITGAPAVSRTISEAALHGTGKAAVRAITSRPNGYFFVDLTEDAGGLARVTEINAGRFGTTIHFYAEAGCNFPHLLVRLAFGEQIDGAPLVDPIAAGTYWIRTLDCGPALVTDLDQPPPAPSGR